MINLMKWGQLQKHTAIFVNLEGIKFCFVIIHIYIKTFYNANFSKARLLTLLCSPFLGRTKKSNPTKLDGCQRCDSHMHVGGKNKRRWQKIVCLLPREGDDITCKQRMGPLFFHVARNWAHFTLKLFRCNMAFHIWRPVRFEDDGHSERVPKGLYQLILANIYHDMI